MVRFTDKAREFWLEQSLDKGEMPKRDNVPAVFSGTPSIALEITGGRCHAFIIVAREFMGGNWQPDPSETFTLWLDGETPIHIDEVTVHYV